MIWSYNKFWRFLFLFLKVLDFMVWLIGAGFRVLLSIEWIGLPEKCGFNLKDKTENRI
jgi:hypothetical protein